VEFSPINFARYFYAAVCNWEFHANFAKKIAIMSKNKSTKQNQPLNPEKYIRQKSRNLPLCKCWINDSWESGRSAYIIIARQHKSGNVTACTYLVDLGCLGVKDTAYFFNVPLFLLMEKMNLGELKFIDTVSYERIHNIIYSAIEYAAQLGFEPHRDFTQTTCFFLEKDDNIPRIEISCGGKDGKPFYVNAGGDSPAREKQILNQLNRVVGEGNYHYLLGVDADNYDEYDDYEKEDYEEERLEIENLRDEFLTWDKPLQEKTFLELVEKTLMVGKAPENSAEKILEISVLAGILVDSLADKEEIEKHKKFLEEKIAHPLVEESELPNSLFAGVREDESELILNMYFEAIDAIIENDDDVREQLEKFKNLFGDKPVACFLELFYWEQKDKEHFLKLLEKYHRQHPDYFLFQIMQYPHSHLEADEAAEEYLSFLLTLLSKETQAITDYEYSHFLYALLMPFLRGHKQEIFAKILAFENYMMDLSGCLDAEITKNILSLLAMAKIMKLLAHLNGIPENNK
jgi:hypothetical protein